MATLRLTMEGWRDRRNAASDENWKAGAGGGKPGGLRKAKPPAIPLGLALSHGMSEGPAEPVTMPLRAILERGEHLGAYAVSKKACAGMLRRAEKHGKTIPPRLEAALRQVAEAEA